MLTFLLALAAGLTPAQPIPDLTTPEVMVTIQPSSMDTFQLLKRRTPYTYSCGAAVSQADSHKIYISADLTVVPGKTEKITQKSGDYSLDFAVTIKGGRAESVVVVKRGEQMLTRQRSTVMLNAAADAGIVPLR